MKYILSTLLLILSGCSSGGSDKGKAGGDSAPVQPRVQCSSIKAEMEKMDGLSAQEVFLRYSEWMIQNPSCSAKEVATYLDSVLTVECGNNCFIKERK